MKNKNALSLVLAAALGLMLGATPAAAIGLTGIWYLSPDGNEDLTTDPSSEGIRAISANGLVAGGFSAASAILWADGTVTALNLPGGPYADIFAISADGTTAVGGAETAGSEWHAASWINGVATDLGVISGGSYSEARYVSADGSVIAGGAADASFNEHAVVWVDGVIEDIGTLGGDTSHIGGLSRDGSVAVGWADDVSGYRAFRYTVADSTLHDLGTLGGTNSQATGVSDDGSVVVGQSDTLTSTHAFRYTASDDTMYDLGTLGGSSSSAYAVSGDGSVVVGQSYTSGDSEYHVFRYTASDDTMNDIGTLTGGTQVYVGAVSSDGNTIVGQSEITGGDYHAFIWKEAVGTIQDLNDVAADAGVDMTGWTLINAIGVSDSGNTVIGYMYPDSGSPVTYILSLADEASGLITEEELLQSLAPSQAVAQQGSSAVQQGIGYSMFTARQALASFAPAQIASNGPSGMSAGAPYVPAARRSAYATGTFGLGQNGDSDNHTLNGSAGLLFRVGDNWVVGGGVIGGTSTVKTHLGGHSDVESIGGSLLASYEQGKTGFRLYGAAAAAYMYVDETRHYMNGSSIDASAGSTNGIGYGAALHAGWAMPVAPATTLEPYVEAEYSQINMQGYTEHGGAFAASYSDHDMHRLVSRLGAAVSHDVDSSLTVGARAAWGHRLNGDGGSFNATSASLTLPLSGNVGDRDWAEVGLNGRYKLSNAAALSAEIVGRTGKIEDSRLQATIGLNYAF